MVRTWTVVDFVVIWLAGTFGATALFALGGAIDLDTAETLLAGLAGQYLGSLAVYAALRPRKEPIGFAVEGRDPLYAGLGLLLQMGLALLLAPLAERLFPDGRPPQEMAEALSTLEGGILIRTGLILSTVLLAPAVEELLFRGVLLKALRPRGDRFALVVSSAAFSAIHVLGLDFDNLAASAALVLPPLFLLGVLLGWLTLRSGRLGPAIFAHSGWNLLAALVLLIPQELLETAT